MFHRLVVQLSLIDWIAFCPLVQSRNQKKIFSISSLNIVVSRFLRFSDWLIFSSNAFRNHKTKPGRHSFASFFFKLVPAVLRMGIAGVIWEITFARLD